MDDLFGRLSPLPAVVLTAGIPVTVIIFKSFQIGKLADQGCCLYAVIRRTVVVMIIIRRTAYPGFYMIYLICRHIRGLTKYVLETVTGTQASHDFRDRILINCIRDGDI